MRILNDFLVGIPRLTSILLARATSPLALLVALYQLLRAGAATHSACRSRGPVAAYFRRWCRAEPLSDVRLNTALSGAQLL